MKILLSEITLPEHDLRAKIDGDALEELADSMASFGQLQPIGLKVVALNRYEVVFGARRFRAAKLLGWEFIETRLLENADSSSSAGTKLVENIHRENLTPVEEAYGLIELIGDGQTDLRILQKQTGKSRDWIRSRLGLLNLPEDTLGALQAGLVSMAVARELGLITCDAVRLQYLRAAIENGASAETAAAWAAQATFAETGIAQANASEDLQASLQHEPQVVDQQYHCFRCSALKSWREVNTLVLCRICQDFLSSNRSANVQVS